jgi:hypothetical protein
VVHLVRKRARIGGAGSGRKKRTQGGEGTRGECKRIL